MRFSTRIICDIGSGPAVPGNMAHCHPGSLYYILMGLTSRKQANPSICKWGKKMKRGQKMKIVSPKRRMGFPGGTSSKESPCQCGRCKRCGFDPWIGKIPWSRAWQPTLVFLPGESLGQRRLVDYGPWGRKELDTTEVT